MSNVEQDTIRWRLLRGGLALEYATLGWNVVGIVVLAITALTARSVALAGFGLDSLIEIGASPRRVRRLHQLGKRWGLGHGKIEISCGVAGACGSDGR